MSIPPDTSDIHHNINLQKQLQSTTSFSTLIKRTTNVKTYQSVTLLNTNNAFSVDQGKPTSDFNTIVTY